LGVCALVTAVVTTLSFALPADYAAQAVGIAFVTATYLLVLRSDAAEIRRSGLSLGGIFEPTPLHWRTIALATTRALFWAAVCAAIVFPPYWYGFVSWWEPRAEFHFVLSENPFDEALGQLLVVALPEEMFFRGYLQTRLDDAWRGRINVFGAQVGWSLVITSVLFALGHYATVHHPARLSVFFPSLLFGWLRCRSGGVGAPSVFHASSNLFASMLGRGYGLFL
jgi:membrane protease YdiL (CAAX protease family)